ncbi:hypothetical protein GCM10022221_49910 [Actinocorallia aurea]
MKLDNVLTIPVPAAEAWKVLLDIERIAPCVPGATLTARDGDSYSGRIKVKLGPIGLSYNGTVTFVSQDEEGRVAVLEASGRETRGNGTAKAVVTCRLVEAGESTDVLVETDLAITGRPAQFGRGALSEVAGALIGRFAENLAAEIASGAAPEEAPGPAGDAEDAASEAAASEAAGPRDGAADRATPRAAAAPIDLLDAAGGRAAKHVGTAVVGTTALLLLMFLRRAFTRRGSDRAS